MVINVGLDCTFQSYIQMIWTWYQYFILEIIKKEYDDEMKAINHFKNWKILPQRLSPLKWNVKWPKALIILPYRFVRDKNSRYRNGSLV